MRPTRGALLAATFVICHGACARRPETPAPSAPPASRDEVAALREEVARLRVEITQVKKPAMPAGASPAAAEDESDLWDYAERMDKLRAENARLREELDEKTRTIAKLSDAGVPVADMVVDLSTGPEIQGKVLAVRPAAGLLMLSVGSDQKVKTGYRFLICRGERYIGKVEVGKVLSNMSSARILRDQTKEPIEVGDDAATDM
ncbi:MAG: hypothetical protein ACYS9X_15245 [Planctomycetota bacterium]|jgi:hypothetical protein